MGKGFYIALAICLAGAGTAAWVTVNSTMDSIQSAPFQEAPLGADWLRLFFWIYGESNTQQGSGDLCLQKQLERLQSQLLEMWLSRASA